MPYQAAAKPFAFYIPKPDISNFPTENAPLSKDFNFLAEFFKFAPQMLTTAMEEGRIGKQNDQGEFESGTTLDGWPLSDAWIEALNEYEVTDDMTWLYGSDYDRYAGDDDWDWSPRNNMEALEYRDSKGHNVWNWSRAWVAGNYHMNIGLWPQKGEWYWGEAVASTISNADFKAEGHEWNHLEEKKSLGVQGMFEDNSAPKPKDTNLDADVASGAYFINDFLSAVGSNWDYLNNNVLKGGGRQNYSYYQLVMNSTQPGRTSYKSLSDKDRVLLVSAMIESRNRAYSCPAGSLKMPQEQPRRASMPCACSCICSISFHRQSLLSPGRGSILTWPAGYWIVTLSLNLPRTWARKNILTAISIVMAVNQRARSLNRSKTMFLAAGPSPAP
jgi:hypothetical protein